MPELRAHSRSKRSRTLSRWVSRTLRATGYQVAALACFATIIAWIPDRWVSGIFQAGVLLCALLAIQISLFSGRRLEVSLTACLALSIACLGIVQIAASATVYPFATREAALGWLVLAALSFLARNASIWTHGRHIILNAMIATAAAAGVLALTGAVRPSQKVLWVFQTESPEVSGFFLSSNEYAQFVELALPAVLMRACWDPKRWILYSLLGALLVGTVIGHRSRMGSALVLIEVVAVLWLARKRRMVSGPRWREVALTMAILCVTLAGAVGVDGLWQRLAKEDLTAGRDVIFGATLDLVKEHWAGGHGLGSFVYVYPAKATYALSGVVNHAHNDWLEAMTEGGIPAVILLLLLLGRLAFKSIRYPWALGLLAISVHAIVDFPLHRLSITAWMFIMAGLLESASAPRQAAPKRSAARSFEPSPIENLSQATAE
jgi:O-antigen ligase